MTTGVRRTKHDDPSVSVLREVRCFFVCARVGESISILDCFVCRYTRDSPEMSENRRCSDIHGSHEDILVKR